uniref:Uncharacterized protein n=1 Tax=Clastoptera arizonana TaxID=38151 RepID=A0A1B6E466_9HEMI
MHIKMVKEQIHHLQRWKLKVCLLHRQAKKSNFSHQWTERYKDIKFADDESQSDKQKSFDDDVEDDSAPFRDTEFTGAINLEEFISKTLKTASSGSIQMSGKDQKSSVSSSERLQTGVIEEIDSDEFFLREKGLSREDVDISRFLSLEIRDAFRSPKNALASMEIDSELYDRDDYDLEPTTRKNLTNPMRRSIEAMSRELVEPMRMTPELEQNKMEEIINYCQPSRPTRTISLKKQSKQNKIEDFNTFPPPRPNRSRKQSISKESLEKYDIGSEESLARPSSVPSLSVSDTSKDQKFEIDKNSSSEAVNWQQPPLPPKRRKSSSKDLSYKHCLEKDLHENENWKRSDDVEIMVPEKITALQLEATNEAAILSGYYDSPSFPLNQKQQSRGTSLADEDRTSRGAESFSSETRETFGEDRVLNEINVNLAKSYDDYAVVEKPPHSQRQSQLSVSGDRKKTTTQIRALKNHGINFFFTYPRRAIRSLQKEMPVRPIRNYSSIRPSRPPRRNRVFREPVYVESEIIPLKNETNDSEIKTEQIIKGSLEDINKFISNEEDVQETRDLQSGDVIEKMKGRPLPPPPRPPRKNKEDSESRQEEHLFEGSNIQVTDLDESDDEGTTCVKENITEENTVQENLFLESVNLDFSELCDNNEKHSFPMLENTSNDPPVKKERKRKSLSHSSSNLISQNPYFTFGETSVSTQTDPLSEYLLSTCEDVTIHDNVENQNVKKSLSCDSEYLGLKSHKMKLSELDVEQLKVKDLQAQRIIVSEIDSVTMQISEISSKSGHLVINGIELPNSFLENVNPPIQTSTPGVHQQTQSSIQTETRDSETMTEVHNTCTIYQSEPLESQQSRNEFTSSQVPPEENLNQLTIEKKKLNSSSDEDILTRSESVTGQFTQDINATELAKQLVKIWQKSFLRGVNKVVDAFPEAEKSKDALTAACIVVVLIAGLMIMGLGQERTVHHHHWDFIPPSI